MPEVLESLHSWIGKGGSGALATVVSTWGSAPRQIGAKMAVDPRGEMVGSVSGGCVEAAVAQAALESLKDGRLRLLHYSVSDEQAWGVGLTCGGDLEVVVEPFAGEGGAGRIRILGEVIRALSEGRSPVRAIVIRGPEGALGDMAVFDDDGEPQGLPPDHPMSALAADARRAAKTGSPLRRTITLPEGPAEVFLDPVMPPPTLIIVGGVHIAIILTRLARAVGFRVVLIDPRRAFATPERFPDADEVLRVWPDEALRNLRLSPRTAVAVLSHDPKLDDPALLIALRSRAGYVGALGSQATMAARRVRLAKAGLREAELDRLRAPIGIPALGESPEAIALGILTEIAATPALGLGNLL